MDDLALHRHKVLGVANHPVIKTRTHGQQHIAVLHGVVGFNRAVHAQHA